jgi:hypothetical protein
MSGNWWWATAVVITLIISTALAARLIKHQPENKLARFARRLYLSLYDLVVSALGCFALAVVGQAVFIGLIVLVLVLIYLL